jgi:hypothetical protein
MGPVFNDQNSAKILVSDLRAYLWNAMQLTDNMCFL